MVVEEQQLDSKRVTLGIWMVTATVTMAVKTVVC